jgi:hypothetical protein
MDFGPILGTSCKESKLDFVWQVQTPLERLLTRWCNWLGEPTEMIDPGPALLDVSHGRVPVNAQDVTS